MPRYLLSCECGKTVPVEVRQAGGRVPCACGATLDVPTLRRLRHLPVEEDVPSAVRAPWTVRHGAIAAGLILAGILAAVVLWIRVTEPKVESFDPETWRQGVGDWLEGMSPAEAWESWLTLYRPLAEQGFREFQFGLTPAQVEQLSRKRFLETALLIAAGLFSVASLAVVLWPKK